MKENRECKKKEKHEIINNEYKMVITDSIQPSAFNVQTFRLVRKISIKQNSRESHPFEMAESCAASFYCCFRK